MTKEYKDLLLRDLSARSPYGFIVHRYSDNVDIKINTIDDFSHFLEYSNDEKFKPYLRPMSSMTEEEKKEAKENGCIIYHDTSPKNKGLMVIASPKGIDWLNAHHFDYRNLIEQGLAIETPEGMYKF